jgi:hypothetical protein
MQASSEAHISGLGGLHAQIMILLFLSFLSIFLSVISKSILVLFGIPVILFWVIYSNLLNIKDSMLICIASFLFGFILPNLILYLVSLFPLLHFYVI